VVEAVVAPSGQLRPSSATSGRKQKPPMQLRQSGK